jgi:hypothetical protein
MSQAGIANLGSIPPPPGSITDLQGQDGVTVPPNGSGIIFVVGAVAAAGTTPFTTTGNAGTSTETWTIQRTQAAGVSAANIVGLAAFNSAQFTVDANGFVSLAGGGEAVDSFAMQTGTSPVVPTGAGLVTFNGAVVAAGTNPVRTDGTGANTMALEVQITQALAATDATKIGLANFDSAAFDVDANGFVQLNGGGIAATAFTVQANTAPGTNPVVPTASGVVTVNGAVVAAHSVPIETRSRAANAYNVEVQYSSAVAATDATKSGIAHFNSAQFSVDANGFVSSLGAGFPWTDQGTSIILSTNNGYFVTAATTQTLPASPSQGDVVKIICSTSGAVVVTANTGQVISIGSLSSSTGGTATSTASGDSLELIYRASTSTWRCLSTIGNWILV